MIDSKYEISAYNSLNVALEQDCGVNNFGEFEKFHWINTVNYPSSAVNILTKMHGSEYLGISELAETWGYDK